MLGAGKNTVEIIIAAKDRTQAAFAKVSAQMKGLEGVGKKLTNSFTKVAKAGALIGGAAVIAGIVGSVKAFTDFEDAMANVRKTTGFTKEEIDVLGDSINKLALRIPVAQTELAGIAAIAGQLGIQGKENILSFTEDVAKMSTAFDMSAESAATAMAKMSNIYGIPIEQASALGSAINVLGNTTAAQESAIMNFSMSLGASAKQLGFSATEAVSMGASLISMGMDASDSGTRLNAAFTQMGKKVGEVAAFLDLTEKEFKEAFGADPMAMMTNIIGKLSQIEDPLERNTAAAELFGAIGAKAINGLGGNLEGLQTNLANAAAGFKENTSLTEEFAAKTDTLKAKFTLLKNSITSLLIDIGGELAPTITKVIDGFRSILPAVKEVLSEIGAGFGEAFESISRQIAPALAPFTEKVKEMGKKISGGFDFKVIMDDIGVFIGAGLKPLIVALGWVIDKLGPLWEGLHKVGEAFHFLADKLRTEEGRLDNFKDSLEETNAVLKTTMDEVNAMAASLESTVAVPVAVLKEWKIAVDAFAEGEGSSKAAIAAINAEIEKQTDLIAIASGADKKFHEDNIRYLNEQKKAIEEQAGAASKYVESVIDGTEKAIEKTEEFTVTIGDTTVSFKDATAEVLKNADAYEKLQDSAQRIMDLDWSVFAEFEASLPNIEAGIQDMASAFTGLEGILENNIEELESVKESVMGISEIAAPFLESGFLNGIKSIGSFAGSLKDAGSAINTFSSLQDVSIKGCIDFSMHVHDMVSALEILESQMEDLVPSFAEMDSLITDIADAFVYSSGKGEAMADKVSTAFGNINNRAKEYNTTFDELLETYNKGDKSWQSLHDVTKVFGGTLRDMHGILADWNAEIYNSTGRLLNLTEMLDLAAMSEKERIEWLKKEMHTNVALTKHMDKQTNALKAQTGQLSKITGALQPYLEFMRTLNELAALSALSTDDLNSGLQAINDTLVNLSKSLETFDLRPVMESLFGTKITAGEDIGGFTGGIAKGFTEVMSEFATPFSNLIVYVERLTSSIFSLVSSFEALSSISDSVLADQTKLKEVFEGITTVMTNFSTEMGGTEGFAQKFADGMDAMLKSASPLIKYYQDNNAAIELFNKSLSSFSDTITNVIGVFEDLASVVERSSELIVVSAEEIETALSLVDDQLIEIVKYIESPAWDEIVTQLGAVSKEWEKWALAVDNSMPAFGSAVDTFSTLISTILGLSSALEEMRDMTVFTVRDMDKALKNIPIFLDRFVDALALNMYEIKRTLKDLDREWALHTDEMKATIPTYEDATDKISKLISPILSLNSALKQLAEMGTISATTFDKGFISLMDSVSNFAVSLGRNVDGLILSLSSLRKVWIENEDVLYPLIYDFAIISDNLWGVAHNANRMAKEFKNISDNAGTLEKGFKDLIVFIESVVRLTKEFYTTEAAAELALYIDDVGEVIAAFVDLEIELKSAMDKIKTAIGSAVDNIKGKISSLDNLVKSAFLWGANTLIGFIGGIYSMEAALALAAARMAGTVAAYLDGLVHSAYYWGSNLMIGFINGIYSMEAALALAAARMAATVKAYLGASSNTEKGPLSNLEQWGGNIVRTISEGLRSEIPTLNAAFGSLSPSMAAGTASGRGGSATIYITNNISDRETADYANKGLERVLQRHAIM